MNITKKKSSNHICPLQNNLNQNMKMFYYQIFYSTSYYEYLFGYAQNQKLKKTSVYITRMGYSGLQFTNRRKQFEKFHIKLKVVVRDDMNE